METQTQSQSYSGNNQAEDRFTKTVEEYHTVVCLFGYCGSRNGGFPRFPNCGARQVGQLHRAVGTHLADHRAVQQNGQAPGARSL